MRLKEGSIIHNRYVIKRYISSGGFGNTYEAFDQGFEERVAIKELFISTICSRDVDSRDVVVSNPLNKESFDSHKRRFVREARRLRIFSHPNIVSVTDVFESNGTAYFVMDYVEGKSLASFPLPMPESRLKKYLNQILSALDHVHQKGILHLDIKPSNIMIDRNDNAILIDFGASKLIDSDNNADLSTSTVNAYTPGYAPLEQMSATNSKNLGPHSDIYALAATLYTLLSGQKPPLPNEILLKPLAPLSNVSPQLREAIDLPMKVLFPQRLASVEQFRRVLAGEIVNIASEQKTIEQPTTQPLRPQPASSLNEPKAQTKTITLPKQSQKPTPQPNGINAQMKPWDNPNLTKKPTLSSKKNNQESKPKHKGSDKKKTIIATMCMIGILIIVFVVGFWLTDNKQSDVTTPISSDTHVADSVTTPSDTATQQSAKKSATSSENRTTSEQTTNTPTAPINSKSAHTKQYPTPNINSSTNNNQYSRTTNPKSNRPQRPTKQGGTQRPTKQGGTIMTQPQQQSTQKTTNIPAKKRLNDTRTKEKTITLPSMNKMDKSNNTKVTIPQE